MNMNIINDPALTGMLPFDTMGLYEPPKPRYIFKMPRVVPDQKDKFENDDIFRKLSRDSEVSIFPQNSLHKLRTNLFAMHSARSKTSFNESAR